MENATKALLIAGGVLIGIMILSLGVSLYSSLSEYVELTQEEMLAKKIQEFNLQFTKYINYNNNTNEKDFTLTIQDIVTAANTAYESNTSHGLESYDGSNYYVTINMSGQSNLEELMDLKSSENSKIAEILADGLEKEYKCSYEDVKFNTNTGRVYEVNFHEI